MIPELHFPWLECSILLPLLGAIACGLLRDPVRSQRIAVICGVLTLFCTTGEWLDFAMIGAFEAHDHWDMVAVVLSTKTSLSLMNSVPRCCR
jgi:NADH-quinone oxidoreductase subunit M